MYRRPFKNPISSNINEIRITATNVKVAFQTIPVTSNTLEELTTPVMIATTAPIKAVIPISKPLVAKLQRLKLKEKSQLLKLSSSTFT